MINVTTLQSAIMRFGESVFEIPTWTLGVVLIVFVASLGFGALLFGHIFATLAVWIGLIGIALGLFVVYLLYRFVIAVEEIADKL